MKRPIGNAPYATGPLALGGVTFGREIGRDASFAIMDHALARGFTLFDTAEVYGGGASERIVGEWMRERGTRGSIVLETKTLAHRPDDVLRAIDGSLERLKTDKIDLYLLHRLSPETPIGETLDALRTALNEGRIGAIGCSNVTADQLRTALAVSTRFGLPRFEVQQPIYNLAAREMEDEFLPLCRRENIAAIGYSPLGAGFLTGKYLDNSIPAGSRFDLVPGHQAIYFNDRSFGIVRALRALSETAGLSMAKLAMAWALHKGDLTAVLVGARTLGHVDNALEALDAKLPPGCFEEMDRFSLA